MKLRNKKTGKIAKLVGYVKTGDDRMFFRFEDDKDTYKKEYNSLTELERDWEDYEEPKDIWWLDNEGCVNHASGDVNDSFRKNRKIGNYFLSREEAEKAVEKLKAWKRLKDKGFRFVEGRLDNNNDFIIKAKLGHVGLIDQPDVQLLFGGEQ